MKIMERSVTLEDLSDRYPQVERDLPKGSLEIIEEPQETSRPQRAKRTVSSIGSNLICGVVAALIVAWIIHYFPEVIPDPPTLEASPAPVEASPSE